MVQALEEIIPRDIPRAFQLLKEMNESVQQVTQLVDNMLARVKRGEVSTDNGLSFLEVKYHMLLSYLINLTYVVLRKCSGEKIEDDPAIDRLVEIRTVLEKMRPIDHKLKYQIDKLVKTAITGSTNSQDPSNFRANPANMISKLVEEEVSESGSEQEEPTGAKQDRTGVYVPPKLAAVHYDGDENKTDRQQRILERAKKRALNTSMIQELREEYLDTPMEITHESSKRAVLSHQRREREEYEENYFTRLPLTKQDRHKSRRMTTLGTLGQELTQFGDLRALEGGAGPSASKKRKCWWPQLDPGKADNTIHFNRDVQPVRALLLADTHLLGSRNGHWFDKLRREWQMYRAFQTAMAIHKPDVVFVLGDLFDEGLWCSEKEFKYYVQRFHDLFAVPEGTELYVVVGNHDVGFHYGISPYLQERFSSAFSAPSVKFVTIKGNYFVLINSMAMEGDGCFLCRPAELQLQKISRQLKCTKGVGKCVKGMELEHYSRPILLQHFPMYRESDADCHEPDQAPEDLKTQKFRERWECLSRESSEVLFDELKPRLIVTGHTHHGCNRIHRKDIHEWTISSFSWRNKDNPSFMLVVVSPNNYALSKCYMPQESTVITTYMVGAAIILIWVMLTYRRLCRRSRLFKKK
uniref:Metallophosphoesterase 1 homolog n=2 Tax=Timema TaxID=61471 RepID=A0A7R9IAW2_9NEOP|nr:unnamed protein product [Timema tahoe]